MAPTKLDICNMALGFLGTRTISQTELTNLSSPEAIQCDLYWDRARRAVLLDYPYEYKFAVRRAALVPAQAPPPSVYAGSWTYCYAVPENALKILSVHEASSDRERHSFTVIYTSGMELVLCNIANADVTYTFDEQTISLWDEKFISAMAMKLAVLASTALLKNNPQKIQELMQLYQASLPGPPQKAEGWAVPEANSKLGVMNMALGLAGARMITSVAENCDEAVQCNLYFDRARRSVLRDFPYRFAVRRMALTTRALPVAYSGTWTNCYTAPADLLKVLSIHGATDKNIRQPYSVEYLSDATVILCNVANAQIVYTADVENPALWDERFTAAMAAKLALFICAPLLKGAQDQGLNKAKELGELYKASIPQTQDWEESGWSSSGDSDRLNICNIALGYIGASMITSLTENVPEAVQCNLHWDRARRAVLRDYPYRFAIHRGALTAMTMPAVHGGEWSKAYTFPADALRVLSVHNGTDKEARQPFAVEYTGTGTAILCNINSGAEATYIADVPDTSLWDEKFTQAMSRRLAMQIAGALLPAEVLHARMQEFTQLYQMSLPGPAMTEENWAVEADVTRLNVCNMALSFAGAKMISSTTENSQEALSCSLHWDNARRSALRDFPYRFAQRRFQLVAVTMPALYARQWRYAYEMPECLKIVRVHDGFDRIHRIPFALENVEDQMVIFCNVPNAMATCTIDVEDTSKWDEMFITMMARKLAIFIFPALFTRGEAGRNEPKRA